MTISVAQVRDAVSLAVDLALLLIFAVVIVSHFGVSIPMVPTMQPLTLLYLTAAWAFLKGRIKLG